MKRRSVQRCGVPAAAAMLVSARSIGSQPEDSAGDEGNGHLPSTTARLSHWKRAAMADRVAAERTQSSGTNGLRERLTLDLRSGHLRLKQCGMGISRSAHGVSTRVGSLTNGLP